MKKIIGVTVGTPTNPREIAKQILVHSDWGQNNPAEDSYVQNRTHWQENSKTVVTWNGNTENRLTYTNALNEVFYQISKVCPSEEDILGATIEYSSGNVVKVTSKHFTGFTNGRAAIGSSLFAINAPEVSEGNVIDNGVMGLYAKAGDTYPAVFTYGEEVIHPLDEKFIPESIARKGDIEPGIEAYIAEHPTIGQPGKDGFSPTAIVAESTDGATITITDKNGTTYATVKRGPQGPQGVKGDKGDPGAVQSINGYTPNSQGDIYFDWVARKDEEPVQLELGVVSAGFNSKLKYELFENVDEVAVTFDGRMYLCVPELGYVEGDGYYVYVGNKSLLSSSQTDTGEPFLIWGNKGASLLLSFEEGGTHEMSLYGYKITANPLPEEYLPDCVVKSVNGVKPDGNGNVTLSGGTGGGSGQNGNGVTTAQANALYALLKVCSFAKEDTSAEFAAFEKAFGIADSGGEEEPDEPVAPEVTLTSISAMYGGGSVPVGTAVTALTGIVVTAHYSDGSTQTVTGYTLSGTIAEGNNTIAVSYGGKTTSFSVVGIAESGGDEPGGDEVTIYEPEANIVVTTTLDIDNTLVNVDTGATSTNASWCASDYVAIPGGKDYLAIQTENTSSIRYALYDSEKVFIKGGTLSGVTALAIEYPANAAYIRLSNNKTNIGTVTLSAGNNMVTSWGDPGNNGLDDNGNISATGNVYRISDGYVKIPDGARTLFWGNKSGYSFAKVEGVVYDSGYSAVGKAGSNTAPEAKLGVNFTVNNKIDLTGLSNAMYLKAHVNDGSSATNNNPAEQYVFGYI